MPLQKAMLQVFLPFIITHERTQAQCTPVLHSRSDRFTVQFIKKERGKKRDEYYRKSTMKL